MTIFRAARLPVMILDLGLALPTETTQQSAR